jgi:hypothetical protein
MVGKTYGVVKAYTTRVGGGPFPTEQLNVSFYPPLLPRLRCVFAAGELRPDVLSLGYWRTSPGGRPRVGRYNRPSPPLWLARPCRPPLLVRDQRVRCAEPDQAGHPRRAPGD